MNQLKKIVGINILILLVYSTLIQLWAQIFAEGVDHAQLAILIFMMMPIGAQVAINLIISIVYFVKSNNDMGKVFLLSTIIILLVGFSSCWGNSMLTLVL